MWGEGDSGRGLELIELVGVRVNAETRGSRTSRVAVATESHGPLAGRPRRRRRSGRSRGIGQGTAISGIDTLLALVASLVVGQVGCVLYQPVDPSLLWHPFEATAYCDEGFTASGAYVRDGIVAADPRVLPLGSVIDIRIDDRVLEGYEVMDTGGGVKGYKIDIWMSSCDAAVEFGRRAVKVRVRRRGTLRS